VEVLGWLKDVAKADILPDKQEEVSEESMNTKASLVMVSMLSGSMVNLQAWPGSNAVLVKRISIGTVADAFGYFGSRIQVKAQGKTGYMMMGFLRIGWQ